VRYLRGQLSLENMMLLVVGLSLITISLASLGIIHENAINAFNYISFSSSAASLKGAVEEVCIMGQGNQLKVYLRVPIIISADYDSYTLEYNGATKDIPMMPGCKVTSSSEQLSGNVIVSNAENKIYFTNQNKEE
jgi:hypothetical protein